MFLLFGIITTPVFSVCTTATCLDVTSNITTLKYKDANGTSQFMFNSYPGKRYEINYGTTGSPVTTAGPTFKLSRTENVSAAQCGANPVDNECNATVAFYNYGTSSDGMQVTAGYIAAIGNGSSDAVGVNLIGRAASGTGIGTGTYIEGRRDVNTAKALGAEARVSNITSTDGTYNTNGISDTQGFWVTCNSFPSGHPCGEALGIDDINNAQFLVGLSFKPGSIKNTTFDDLSSSTTSIHIGGSHKKTVVIDAAAAHAGQGACWTTDGQLGYFDNTNTCIGL